MKPGPLKNLCVAAAVLVLLAIITSPVLAIWMIRQEADHIHEGQYWNPLPREMSAYISEVMPFPSERA